MTAVDILLADVVVAAGVSVVLQVYDVSVLVLVHVYDDLEKVYADVDVVV